MLELWCHTKPYVPLGTEEIPVGNGEWCHTLFISVISDLKSWMPFKLCLLNSAKYSEAKCFFVIVCFYNKCDGKYCASGQFNNVTL